MSGHQFPTFVLNLVSFRIYYTAATVGGCRILLHIQAALHPRLVPEYSSSFTDSAIADEFTRGTVGVWKNGRSTDQTAISADFELGLPNRSSETSAWSEVAHTLPLPSRSELFQFDDQA